MENDETGVDMASGASAELLSAIASPFGKYWMIDVGFADSALALMANMSSAEMVLHIAEFQKQRQAQIAEIRMAGPGSGRAEQKRYKVSNGVAYVYMSGPMTKSPTCMSMFLGGAFTSVLRSDLRAAVGDPDVRSIMLVIDSPGGTVDGSFDLAYDVFKLNAQKPIDGYIEDLGASAAYLVGSQCRNLYMNANGAAGSIGVYTTLIDSRGAHAQRGMKIHVVKAGANKAIGHPGTEITDANIAHVQQRIDRIQGLFVRAVSRGRGLDDKAMAKVADGSVFIGNDAKRLGLVDSIKSLDDAHAEAVNGPADTKKRRTPRMEEQVAADMTDIRRWLAAEPAGEDNDTGTADTTAAAAAEAVAQDTTTAQQPEQPAQAAVQIGLTAGQVAIAATELADLRERATMGDEYIGKLRQQVGALAVIALGQTEGATAQESISTMNMATLRAIGKQYVQIGVAKGLMEKDGVAMTRDSAPAIAAGGSATADTGQKTTRDELVATTRNNLEATGLYGL